MTGIDTVAPLAAMQDVHRAAHCIRRRLEHEVLAPHDLTWTLWSILWVAWRKGEIDAYELATRTGHPDDTRPVLVSLTPSGEALMAAVVPLVAAQESALTSTLTPDERRVLWTSLRKVVAAIDAAAPPRARSR